MNDETKSQLEMVPAVKTFLADCEALALAEMTWIKDMQREIGYRHWSADSRAGLKLALKWWYKARQLPIPTELL
jgi:hypothetical protein